MPQRHQSAMRQHRRSERARNRNRQNTARLRTRLKKVRSLIAANDGSSRDLLPSSIALIDRSVTLGAIHKNAAARLKSRLTRQVARLT